MPRFTIYTYLFKPINEPYQPELFSPEVKVEESMGKKLEIFGSFFKVNSTLRFHRGNQQFEQGQTDMQLSTFMLIANALGLRFSLVVG